MLYSFFISRLCQSLPQMSVVRRECVRDKCPSEWRKKKLRKCEFCVTLVILFAKFFLSAHYWSSYCTYVLRHLDIYICLCFVCFVFVSFYSYLDIVHHIGENNQEKNTLESQMIYLYVKQCIFNLSVRNNNTRRQANLRNSLTDFQLHIS